MKLLFCPFYAHAGGNDLSYLNHIIIVPYNASYGCGKCLKQAYVSSSALHNHKKVCLGLVSRKSAGGSDGKPGSGGGGNSSCRGSSKATPKRTARLLSLIPRTSASLLLPNHHHATVDERPPTTTSPIRTQRTQVGRKRR